MMRVFPMAVLLVLLAMTAQCARETAPPAAQVVRRYAAVEANQGVAVDGQHFYAIDNAAIGKYEKSTGTRVARWAGTPAGAIAHLNGGTVHEGLLYCAHSNYPETPMVSSIEVFDTDRMTHVRSVPLPGGLGSATWVDRKDDTWWVTFAHYAGEGGEPGKGPAATSLVRFDRDWGQLGTWVFPRPVVARWGGMSSSGGAWADERRLYTTGHDARELYVLELPASGRELALAGTIAIESQGQGIAFDRPTGLLYSIQRQTREVLASKLPEL
jgi:hypothetical protein